MGILISRKSREKKISTVECEERVVAVHIVKNESSRKHTENSTTSETSGQNDESNPANFHSGITSSQPEVDESLLSVLRGDITNYSTFKAKIVRIFISSTFTDTFVERNVLMKDVYPRLKKFCQEHGYEFQVVDMRWGIRNESLDEHETIDLCIREIKNCQKISTGPSFVSLLSEKYGFRPIPSKISKDEFRVLSTAIPSASDFELLLSWYNLDENHRPPVYILQPISSHIHDFVNHSDEAARQNAVREWNETMTNISKVLRNAAAQVLFGNERRKYFASKIELDNGVIETNDLVYGCWWFKRNIEGLKEADDTEAEKYLDRIDDDNNETIMCLANLQNRIVNMINENNIRQYNIRWNSKGINLEDEGHAAYISKFCEDVYELISKAVEEKIHERAKHEVNLPVYEEASQHISFAKVRCETFHGRKEELDKIRCYLEGTETYPLVVYGESGSGKTSVLAMVSKCCHEWFCSESAVIIRHLGITPDSSLLRRLLLSLCQQIALLIGQDYDSKQRKIVKVLADDFSQFLHLCESHFTNESPLIIILDSLDQLSPEDGAFQLTWLPTRLPPWVKIVISTISNDVYHCLEIVKGLIPARCFVEIPRLPLDDAVRIVNSWLSANSRTLTAGQRSVFLDAFQKCSFPIFLKVSFEEALRWKSYTPPDEIRLESTVRGAINGLFERIEKRHGKIFVSHSLAYITAAKSGLTESELEDILSCDDDVLDDVFQYWVPPVRRIPPLLWLRMKHDLSGYLVDRGADEAMVVTWYHRQFKEAAIERYLSDYNEKLCIHFAISEFFLGRWANGAKKPFKDKDGSMQYKDRLVSSQVLMFQPEDHCHHGPTTFNLRKLNELPFHLVASKRLAVLKNECLCNYEFLLTQLRACGLSEVLDSFELALAAWPRDYDLGTIHETMKLSTNALMLWPGQLASQLLSRIPKDSIKKSEFLKQLENQAKRPSLMALIPNQACLTSPGGPLLQSLSGSTEPHVSLRLSRDGKTLVSIGERNEMLVWDVHAGRVVRNMECPEGGTTLSCLTSGGDNVVASRMGVIKSWRVSNGQALFEIRGHSEVAPISMCQWNDIEALVTYRSGTLELIGLDKGEILKQYCTKISHYTNPGSKVFLNSFEGICLLVHKDEVEEGHYALLVELFHICSKDKHEVFRVKSKNDIMSLDVVVSNQILVTYVGLAEDLNKNRRPSARPSVASSWQKMTLELWDMGTMKPTSLLTTADESVRCTCITPDRDEVIMLCDISFIETAAEYVCFVKIYSVTAGTSLKLPLSFPSGITSVCGLGSTCLITASADKIIRVWDLERSLDIESRPRKTSFVEHGKIENGSEMNGVNALHENGNIQSSSHIDTSAQRNLGTDASNERYMLNGKGVLQESKYEGTDSADRIDETKSTSTNVEAGSQRHPGWKQLTNLPVGKNFLKLRYSTLSTALQKFDIDSGDCLEDLQVICFHDNIIVYLARRMVDSVYAVVAWQLGTDMKMRISELQNPDACIVSTECMNYLVIVSSSVISVYKVNSGEFIRRSSVSTDDHGSERLSSLGSKGVLLIEAGRRRFKILSIPDLTVLYSQCYDENAVIQRAVCSHDKGHFVICLRSCVQSSSTKIQFKAEVWNCETLTKMHVFDYQSFETEFNDTQLSNGGKVLADIIFNKDELKYRLVLWKENSSACEIVPCDSSLNVFKLRSDGRELLIGTWTGDLLLFNLEKSTMKHLTKAHACPLQFILASDNFCTALTITGVFDSRDRSIRIWNTRNGRMLTEYTPDVKISPVCIASDASFVVVEIRGKLVKLDLLSGDK